MRCNLELPSGVAQKFTRAGTSETSLSQSSTPLLFSPLQLRDVVVRNRIVISPMCQYSAEDGFANDWHLVHAGKFAQGGAGIVFLEATAVLADGRITHGDLGLWCDEQTPALARIAAFIRSQGAVPAIQLGHAGRKSSMSRPWEGNGPLTPELIESGSVPWQTVAPSAEPIGPGWMTPRAMEEADLARVRDAFAAAAARAVAADFDIAEVHAAHGYLLHSFLSPLSNRRSDRYGGDLEGRMRFPLEIAAIVREAWPAGKPVFFRCSSVDNDAAGWSIEDSVVLARRLKEIGVDVVDCSSGGIAGSATAAATAPRGLGFQVPFAERIRGDAGIATMAVGLIIEPAQAEAVLAEGKADLVAIAREALYDPNWPLHAAALLGADGDFSKWPRQYGWWLTRRESVLRDLGVRPPLQ
jgi:2,4-dienoyl-CoA reductase-like NADH-dependent reductase (Old Yellow Enzyme family)